MEQAGHIQFPGSLDPRAEEFRPRNSNHYPPQPNNFHGQNQLYYPYTCSYDPSVGGQAVQFCNAPGGLPYAPFPTVPPLAAGYHVNPTMPVAPPVTPSSTLTATRSLLLSLVPSEMVSESTLRKELEAFGDVRGLQMERVREGMVTVHFYDLRHAETALKEIQSQYMQHQTRLRNHYDALAMMHIPEPEIYATSALVHSPSTRGLISGRPVWAQFAIHTDNAFPGGNNQGTIVLLNLDSKLSSEVLCQIFEEFGPVKEIRGTPLKKNQRFIEYFDIRDAAKALTHLNGKEILDKPVLIQFSRPGGQARRFRNTMNDHKGSTHTNVVHHAYKPRNCMPSPPPAALSSMMPALPQTLSPRPSSDVSDPCSSLSRAHVPARKSIRTEECPNGKVGISKRTDSGACSIDATMASLSLARSKVEELVPDGATEDEEDSNNDVAQSDVVNRSTQQQPRQHQVRGRPWKGKRSKKLDTRYFIKDVTIESDCRDSRTTVMIKNIPNKYSQKLLLSMLDNHCIHFNEQIAEGDDQPLSSYDFVYLPIDFNNKCNVGYGFVNMTSPEAAWRLYKAFHRQHWEVFNSRKICEVTYARVQGLEALKEHFKNSKFPCDMDHYLPVVFAPPRDGRLLTEPTPLVGQIHKQEPEHQSDPGGQSDSYVMDGHDVLALVSDADCRSISQSSNGGGEVTFDDEVGISGSCNSDTTSDNPMARSVV